MESPRLKKPINKLCLNEVFVAEKDVGKTSIYRLQVDDNYLGKFKSSGMLVSTGTGSTGWLYSARRISQSDVRTILTYLGNDENIELVSSHAIFSKVCAYRLKKYSLKKFQRRHCSLMTKIASSTL